MREIKFRLWDEDRKEMLQLYGAWFEEQGDYHQENFSKFGNIMQYTGLKDKNGVEIYEGDIVKIEDEVGFVVWSDDCLSYDVLGEEVEDGEWEVICGLPGYLGIGYEVIGNIYENPELLGDQHGKI